MFLEKARLGRNWKNEMGEGGVTKVRFAGYRVLKYRFGKKYHTVIKSPGLLTGCAPHSVVHLPPLLIDLGWWGVARQTPNKLLGSTRQRN